MLAPIQLHNLKTLPEEPTNTDTLSPRPAPLPAPTLWASILSPCLPLGCPSESASLGRGRLSASQCNGGELSKITCKVMNK